MKTFFIELFNRNKHLFLGLIFFDAVVLVLHLILGNQNHFFHLDFEQNLPTVYQSAKLIGFGSLFFVFGFNKSIKWSIKSFLVPLAFFITFLGLDELFQIHENIYLIFEFFEVLHPSRIVEASMKMGYRSSLWILYYMPFIFIFVFWSGYWLRYFQTKMKKNAWVLILSSLSLFTVLISEILSSTGSYDTNTYFLLVTLEETAEMLLASTLILVGCKILHRNLKD